MAFSIFEGKKIRMLGVDIGTSSVKIVELAKAGEILELSNYGEHSETQGVLQSSSLKVLSTQVAEVVKEILKETGIKERKAAIAVPMFAGFSTVITLPRMPDEELGQAVIYEAKKYVPLPLSEVKFEWSKIERETQNKDKVDLMIVAVTNELISRYQEIARLSGLDLRYIELDVFSLSRALVRKGDGSTLIIDIGSLSTILVMVEGDWPMHTRNLEVGGLEFTKLLASSLGTDFKRAEGLKRKVGVNSAGGVLLPLIDSILSEARRIIDDYAKTRKVAVQKVILSGGGSMMPGLLEYVVKALGKETVIAKPLHGIIYPGVLEETLKEFSSSVSVAVGLALREFQ